ncbi:hypothetical protein B566_EDAN007092 [Ephemera danica]|nr:hypothetical protein B566_EDAN007092 [Ephemera danica]
MKMQEPMTLGSPGNVSPGFMPTFLLGEMATAATSMPPQCETPPNARRGPPTLSLSDTLPGSPPGGASLHSQSAALGSTSFADIPHRSASQFLLEPEEDLVAEEAQMWVTAFGFPASMTPSVLTWLSNCGSVTVRHLPSSSRANWLHLRFSSPAEARRALARNLHLLGPDTMLGVAPCTNKDVMRAWRQGAGDSFSEAGGTFLFSSQLLPPPGTQHSTLQGNRSHKAGALDPDESKEEAVYKAGKRRRQPEETEWLPEPGSHHRKRIKVCLPRRRSIPENRAHMVPRNPCCLPRFMLNQMCRQKSYINSIPIKQLPLDHPNVKILSSKIDWKVQKSQIWPPSFNHALQLQQVAKELSSLTSAAAIAVNRDNISNFKIPKKSQTAEPHPKQFSDAFLNFLQKNRRKSPEKED